MTGETIITDFHFSGTGTLTRDHLELIKLKDDSLYINQDTFSYLLILVFVGLLLMKTIIKIAIFAFNFGFTLTSGESIQGKK